MLSLNILLDMPMTAYRIELKDIKAREEVVNE